METPPKIVKPAIYIRVSTTEQAVEGYGLETQLRHIKDEIQRHQHEGWVFDESLIYKDDSLPKNQNTKK